MDARMLDGANPDFRFVPERFGEVMDAHVVGFSRATGPDDITGMAAKVMRELFASFGHGFVGGMTKLMRAGGIAVNFFRSLQPCLARFANDRRGGVVIEVKHPREMIGKGAEVKRRKGEE